MISWTPVSWQPFLNLTFINTTFKTWQPDWNIWPSLLKIQWKLGGFSPVTGIPVIVHFGCSLSHRGLWPYFLTTEHSKFLFVPLGNAAHLGLPFSALTHVTSDILPCGFGHHALSSVDHFENWFQWTSINIIVRSVCSGVWVQTLLWRLPAVWCGASDRAMCLYFLIQKVGIVIVSASLCRQGYKWSNAI